MRFMLFQVLTIDQQLAYPQIWNYLHGNTILGIINSMNLYLNFMLIHYLGRLIHSAKFTK